MSDEATVIPITSPRMTEEQYDRERERIRETYGDSKANAAGRWEEELAKLFWRSGWTQDELAARESKSQNWVSKRLRFGRFLAFSENKPDRFILSEWKFRGYWDQTGEIGNERQRFREVTRLLEADADRPKHSTHNPVGEALRDHCMDGKWHTPEAMSHRIEQDLAEVERTLGHMVGRASNKYKVERRRHGKGWQYRMFPTEKTVSTLELSEKLVPLIAELKAEGRKNMATIAISRIAKIAAELQEFLNEWTR